jgi:hypothetical protein
MSQDTEKKALTLKTLTKSSVRDVQENDIFRMWESAGRHNKKNPEVLLCASGFF